MAPGLPILGPKPHAFGPNVRSPDLLAPVSTPAPDLDSPPAIHNSLHRDAVFWERPNTCFQRTAGANLKVSLNFPRVPLDLRLGAYIDHPRGRNKGFDLNFSTRRGRGKGFDIL